MYGNARIISDDAVMIYAFLPTLLMDGLVGEVGGRGIVNPNDLSIHPDTCLIKVVHVVLLEQLSDVF